MNVVLVGPCGVGKSTVGKCVADLANLEYIDFDAEGRLDGVVEKPPFSKYFLDFKRSLPIVIKNSTTGFVLDIGGDNVFNRNANNDERLDQVLWVKNEYNVQFVVLTATKDILKKRFFSSKGRSENGPDNFDKLWEEWSDIIKPYWEKCGDIFIDTSSLTVEEIRIQIEGIL